MRTDGQLSEREIGAIEEKKFVGDQSNWNPELVKFLREKKLTGKVYVLKSSGEDMMAVYQEDGRHLCDLDGTGLVSEATSEVENALKNIDQTST